MHLPYPPHMTELEVVDDPIHGAIVVKHAVNPAAQRRLEHERELLRAAQLPGVVELVDGDDDALVTRFAGSESLETVGALEATSTAHIVAALADTLADLHALGIVHGAVEPGHVVLDDGGRPVLCGFAGATYIGTIAPSSAPLPPELTDPARGPHLPAEPSVDVFGLGAVLRLLLEDADVGFEPIPDRRLSLEQPAPPLVGLPSPRPAEPHRSSHRRRSPASTDEPRARGGRARRAARRQQWSRSDGDAAPRGRRRPRAAPADGNPLRRRRRPRHCCSSACRASRTDPTRRRPPAAAVATTQPSSTTVADRAMALDSAAPDLRLALQPSPHPRPTSTATAAPTARPPSRMAVVAVGPVRFAVGDGDSVVVVADLDCDGLATVAVLRPSTGAVFEFTSWPSNGAAATATQVGDAPGAVRLEVSGDPCPSLKAVDADGTEAALS